MFTKRLLKDFIKDKTPAELLELLPLYVCIEEVGGYSKKTYYTSVEIKGINKQGFIYGKTISQYDEDAGFGSGVYYIDQMYELPFNAIDDTYILSTKATPKQMEWLEAHDENPNITSYEAWNIIHNAVEAAMERHKAWEAQKISNDQYDYDDWMPEIGINGF